MTGNLPSLDLSTLDDAWAAVAALSSDDETRGERHALNAVCRIIEQLGGCNPRDQTRRPHPNITDYRRHWGSRLRVEMFGGEKDEEQPGTPATWEREIAMNQWTKGH